MSRPSLTVRPASGPSVDLTDEVVGDVWYASEIPGGFAGCSFTLHRDAALSHPELRAFSDVEIRQGEEFLYVGRIEPPAWDISAEASSVTIEAFGGQRHASDDLYRGIFVDRRLDRFRPRARGPQSDTVEQMELRTDEDAAFDGVHFKLIIPSKVETTLASGARFEQVYSIPASFPRKAISRLFFRWKASAASTALAFRIEDQVGTQIYQADYTTANTTVNLGPGSFPADAQSVILQPFYAKQDISSMGPRTITFWGLRIYGTAQQDDPNTGAEPKPHKIVEEVVRASCPKFSLAGIAVSTAAKVDPLIYPDPVEPRQVFDEMLAFAPAGVTDAPWAWAVWEKVGSLYRLVYEPIPDEIAYETSVAQGARLSGLRFDPAAIFNKAVVHFFDERGEPQEASRTQVVAELDDAGITRVTSVGPIQTSLTAQAERIGDLLLEENKRPARSATLAVQGEDVRERASGASVAFYRIRAGRRIRITDFAVRDPSTAPKHDDNAFLIRRAEVTLNLRTGEGGAALSLDDPQTSAESFLARLSRPGA